MINISVEEFLFWKTKQLSKGGDYQSFADRLARLPTALRTEASAEV